MDIIWEPAAAGNFMFGRQGHAIERIVIHTMVGSMAGALGRFQNPGAQVSAHYGVPLSGGPVVQYVSENDTAYHAGDWSTNLVSIGIEHEDGGDYNGARPDALYATSAQLVASLCARYGIPCDRNHIVKHSEVSDQPTGCPDALDIDRIVSEAAGLVQPAPAPAQDWHQDIKWGAFSGSVMPSEGVNVRTGAGADYDVMGSQPGGAQLSFNGYVHRGDPIADFSTGQPDDRWFHLDAGEGYGWVASAMINGNPDF